VVGHDRPPLVGHGARDLAIAVVLVGSRVLKPMSAEETEVWLAIALLGVTAWSLWPWR